MKTFIKILLVFGIGIFSFESSYAQSIVWRQIIGGPRVDISYNCIESKYGGYLATGFKQIMPSGSMSYISKCFIIKFDNYGNIIWDKIIGDSLSGSSSSTLIEDSFGNIYLPYSLAGRAHLAKLDLNGNILWDKNYSFYNILYFRGVSFVDQYKNLVLLSLNTIQQYYPTSGITKIDSSGNLIWTKSYYDSIPTLFFYTSLNNSFLFTNNFYYICGTKGVIPFIIKTDTSGNIVWNKNYLDNGGLYSISQISENTFIASGRADDLGYLYCMKFDSSGSVYWSKNFRNDSVSNNIGFYKIFKNYDGNFVLGAISSINFGRLVIIDSLGNILLSKFYNYPPGFYIDQNNINNTSDSGYIVAGSLDSDNVVVQNKQLGNSQYDILVFKIDKYGKTVSIKSNFEFLKEFTLYQNYPNPFNPVTNLEFQIPKSGFVTLKIYDLLGKEVLAIVNESLNPGTYKYEFDGSNFPSGVYFYRLEVSSPNPLVSGDYTAVRRMVLLK